MVVGRAVKGQAMGGKFPTQVLDCPEDTDNDLWVPTTSVDPYVPTLAMWFGVASGKLNLVFPNLNRVSALNLAFMARELFLAGQFRAVC